MGGDKIVLLDGAGANGGGAATNGLLSMIPGMFANLIGGNKMDPNLVAALMNGRNNQDGFGGAKAMGITLSTSIDPIMNELNAIKSTSQEIIDSVDAHRAKIEACESILEDINPAFKQTREQDRKIAGIENKVNDLTDSFEDLKKLIVERLK